MNNQAVTVLFKNMTARMTIDEEGLDTTSKSIVQITPLRFKCLSLKC